MKESLMVLVAITLLFVFVGCVGCQEAQIKPMEGVEFIDTDNYANRKLYFYYYIPAKAVGQEKSDILACIPGLGGSGEYFRNSNFKKLADEEGMILISPSFNYDEANWGTRQSYQYPEVWSGQAFLEIINKFEQIHKKQTDKLYLYGFSAGAQFALRFSLWKPEICDACVAYASGGRIIPQNSNQVSYLLGVGRQDIGDRIKHMHNFRDAAIRLGMKIIYKEYEVGHGLTHLQILDSVNFIKEVHQAKRRETHWQAGQNICF